MKSKKYLLSMLVVISIILVSSATAFSYAVSYESIESTVELYPMSANSCCNHQYTTSHYQGGKCQTCYKDSITTTKIRCSKCGYTIFKFNSCGHSAIGYT